MHARFVRSVSGAGVVVFRFVLERGRIVPPLPSVLLSNVRSLRSQFDELVYLIQTRRDYSDCCVFCFTETWLDPLTPEPAALPDGYTVHRADRSPHLSGESKGGGVCFYVNHRWCRDSSALSTSCSPDVERLWLSSAVLSTCRGSLPPLCWSVFTYHKPTPRQLLPVTSLISFTPSRPLTLTHTF